MKTKIVGIFLGLLSTFSVGYGAKGEAPLGVFYFSEMYGHVHQFPSVYSAALTTVACGHPIKVYPSSVSKGEEKPGWSRVQLVGIEGHMQSDYLAEKPKKCFQDRYSQFFNALELSVTEMYYLGRLPSLYIRGRSKVIQ